MGQTVLYIIPFLGLIGILFMFWRSSWVNKQDAGSDQMKKIAKNIADGAMAFLKAEYSVLAIFVVVVAGLLLYSGTISDGRSEEHTSELQSRGHLVCRLLL